MSSIIPEIDIEALVDPNSSPESRTAILEELNTACTDIGFMSVINHGVPQELIERMHRDSKRFFHSPLRSKMAIARHKWNPDNSNTFRGYFPSSVHGKEGWDIADPEKVVAGSYLHEMNKYPPDFTEEQMNTVKEYYTCLHKLGVTIVKAVFEIFNVDPDQIAEALERPNALSCLRLNYYPQHHDGYKESEISAQDGTKLACETHTDSVLFTILHQDLVGGLQVQSPTTKDWHDVPCKEEAFVVNTGKTIQRLTNEKYMATFHRVKFGTEERLSIPFFFEPVGNFMIDPKLLCPNEEPKYESISYESFLTATYSSKAFKEYSRDRDIK